MVAPVQPITAAPHGTPFLSLREQTLGYSGPDLVLTNVSAIPIAWFGPRDVDHPRAGGMYWAVQLAVNEANERGGWKGVPFKLVGCWSENPWGSGVSELARLVYDTQPLAIIGSVDSAATHLAEQVAAKANLPLISPVATDKTATLAGVSWMFSCAPSDSTIAHVLAVAVQESLRQTPGKLALIAATDHGSRMLAREVQKALSHRGRFPDYRYEVPGGATTFDEQLSALVNVQPTAVVVLAQAEDSARLVSALRRELPHAAFFGGPAMGQSRFPSLAGAQAEGIRFPTIVTPNPRDSRVRDFERRFSAERGQAPDYTAFLTYDATRLLLEAIDKAGPSRAAVRQALHDLSGWQGLAGVVRFDGTGQNTRADVRLETLPSGKPEPFDPPPALAHTP